MQVSRPIFCMYFSSILCLLHAPPVFPSSFEHSNNNMQKEQARKVLLYSFIHRRYITMQLSNESNRLLAEPEGSRPPAT